jgi:hypothetical protein
MNRKNEPIPKKIEFEPKVPQAPQIIEEDKDQMIERGSTNAEKDVIHAEKEFV